MGKYPSPSSMILNFLISWSLCSNFNILAWPATASGSYTNNSHHYYCKNEEREALLRFKHDIKVDSCGLLTTWGSLSDPHVHDDCCQWRGVRCSNRTHRVIGLHLGGTRDTYSDGSYDCKDVCLQGKVSPSLLELKSLRYLNLSCNDFSGQPIPNVLGFLPNLMHLDLYNAGFFGEIPHQLGNLSKLTSLDLSYNEFSDNHLYVKGLEWLSRPTLLRDLALSEVDLSQATGEFFQVITNLPFLRTLYAVACSLSPPNLRSLSYLNYSSLNSYSTQLSVVRLSWNNLNDTWILQWLFNSPLNNMSSLSYLDLSDNQLQGPLPPTISNLKHLTYLDLNYNNFEGPLPPTISNLKHLTYLDLSYNHLLGCSLQCAKALANLCSLQTLLFEHSNINGDISNIINPLSAGCAHKSLLSLALSSNQLWGSIPDSIGTFSSLRELYIFGNQLNGTISPSVGQLSKLQTLDLSGNSLRGTFSDNHLSNLSRLVDLGLSDNPALMINITPNWIPPFQLRKIDIGSTKHGFQFPKWLLTQTSVEYLDISNLGIKDTIHPSFWNWLSPNLSYLGLSHNQIFGELPIDITSKIFYGFPTIDLSSNKIEGTVPSFPINVSVLYLNNNTLTDATPLLCPKTKVMMTNIDLSNNLISQKLPNCWEYVDQLEILHLENNNFFGNLPTSIGALTHLQVLHLSSNNFSGELPISLENCRSLLVLDAENNSLTGYIPQGIGSTFKKLLMLNLRRNRFHGRLPLSLCELSHLQFLDLSGNQFSETIPDCINNLKAMANASIFWPELDYNVSKNSKKGYQDIATLMWKGKEQIFESNLQQVKSIDISNNHLEGHIPHGISSLTALVSLDLSGNNLTGSITPDIGLLRSLDLLNLSNNHLCGHIPTSLATLGSLGTLDLSNNNLSGIIPTGPQLQGFNASVYMGNPQLCGPPLPRCFENQAGDNPNTQNQDENGDDNDYSTLVGLYISIILGFIVGFWGVCGTLVLKRSWRVVFFNSLYNLKDKIWRKW